MLLFVKYNIKYFCHRFVIPFELKLLYEKVIYLGGVLMKIKRFLSLFVATALILSTFTTFAADNYTDEIFITSAPHKESIDYSDKSNWAYWNEGTEKSADLFFVCPTVDMGKDGNFNSDVTNEKYRESFVGAINMELGIYNYNFMDNCKLYYFKI